MPSISSSQRRNTFSGGGARVQRATTMKNTKTIQTTRFVPPPPPRRRVRRQGSLPPSPGFCSMISKGGKSLLPNLIDEKADKRNVTAKASSSSSSSSSSSIKPDFEEGDDEEKIILYSQRWVQLGYLACLALISDWVCFSVAATPGTWDSIFHRSPETLIDVFLFTNVAFCFLEPQIVGKFGLRNVVVSAAALMTFGCALRSGLEFNDFIPFASFMPSYTEEVVGTVLVGAAQPFFQCTPTLLSSRWFGKDERALSTSIAINANQIGIAVALPRRRIDGTNQRRFKWVFFVDYFTEWNRDYWRVHTVSRETTDAAEFIANATGKREKNVDAKPKRHRATSTRRRIWAKTS